MSSLQSLAAEFGESDRALRRAAARGAIRVTRFGPRRAAVPQRERMYLRGHWALIRALTAALRTEPGVRQAVLFGSTARGDDVADSDIDLAVQLADDELFRLLALEERLSRRLGRRVDVSRLSDLRKDPSVRAELNRDGRVLIDRARP